jgi:hypothetical protein
MASDHTILHTILELQHATLDCMASIDVPVTQTWVWIPLLVTDDWMRFANIFEIDWSGVIFPGHCLGGGFYYQLTLRAVGPIVLLVVMVVVGLMMGVIPHCIARRKERLPWRNALLGTLPSLLFVAFCLTPSTSTSIFAAWTCKKFEESFLVGPNLGPVPP